MPKPALTRTQKPLQCSHKRETASSFPAAIPPLRFATEFSPLFPPPFHFAPHVMHLVAAVFELWQLALFALWPRLSPPRQNNTNLFCRHAHNTPKKGRKGGKAEEILFSQGEATAQNLSSARKFRLSRRPSPFALSPREKSFQPGLISES